MKRIKDFNSFNESLEVYAPKQAYMGTQFITSMKDPDDEKKDIEGKELTPKVPQFDLVKTLTVILADGNLSARAAQIFPNTDLSKAIKNPSMLGPEEKNKLIQIYNDIILKDYALRQEYDVLKESANQDVCPECGEGFTSQCKCMTTHRKTLEDLKRGHGKRCPNGHTWSYDTPDGKAIILK